MINLWHTITRGSCVSKAWEPPSSRAILIYFEFRSKPSLINVICMDPHSPNKLFATKYCFLIPGDDTSFFFFISFSFGFLLFYVIINFYKNYFIIIIILFIYFHENYFYFFMFRDVPECSVFRVLSTPVQTTSLWTLYLIEGFLLQFVGSLCQSSVFWKLKYFPQT